MTITVSVADAKAKLSDLLRRAEAGEDVVLSRNGEPVARLTALRPREAGFYRGEVVIRDGDWWKPDDELGRQFGQT